MKRAKTLFVNQKALVGVIGELLAAVALIFKGFLIIGWRKKVKGGEIDLLARKGSKIYAIEVKTSFFRGKQRNFRPEDRLDDRKVRAMFKAARKFSQTFHVKSFHVKQGGEVAVGFVAVEISIKWPFLVIRIEPEICYF
ncbi:MAG TPA: YraN family protein [Candidatus Paceibacterota bacterium]